MNGLKQTEKCALVNDALQEMMQNSDEYMFVKDIHSVYRGGSEVMARMAGLDSSSGFIGKTDYDIFPKELAEK